MNANQILSADLLDLVFDDRNKAYGAYELRKSYDNRIKKALGITALVVLLGVGGHLMAGTARTNSRPVFTQTEVKLTNIKDETPPPPPPPPPPPLEQPPVQSIQWTTPVIVDEEPPAPPPTIDEVVESRIDVVTTEGRPDDGLVQPSGVDNGKDVIPEQVNKDEIWTGPVEIETSFNGNWIRFLERNLNPNVPADNGAPVGKYTVLIQFVIDQEGKVSEIKALTNMGYGMEQEAIRVLKKADKWNPAIQNGRQVKTYRRQPITFLINEN